MNIHNLPLTRQFDFIMMVMVRSATLIRYVGLTGYKQEKLDSLADDLDMARQAVRVIASLVPDYKAADFDHWMYRRRRRKEQPKATAEVEQHTESLEVLASLANVLTEQQTIEANAGTFLERIEYVEQHIEAPGHVLELLQEMYSVIAAYERAIAPLVESDPDTSEIEALIEEATE